MVGNDLTAPVCGRRQCSPDAAIDVTVVTAVPDVDANSLHRETRHALPQSLLGVASGSSNRKPLLHSRPSVSGDGPNHRPTKPREGVFAACHGNPHFRWQNCLRRQSPTEAEMKEKSSARTVTGMTELNGVHDDKERDKTAGKA